MHMLISLQYHVSSCIRVAVRLHVAEILRAAGSKVHVIDDLLLPHEADVLHYQGMHVEDIATPTKADPSKLARVLRVLATKHIFKEVAPDTFTNNRLSSLMDTGKDITDILSK